MKIAFYSDNFFPEISGISDSIITLGTELVRQGHTVAFVAAKYTNKEYAKMSDKGVDAGRLSIFQIHRIPSVSVSNSASGQMRMAIPFCHSLPFIKRFKPDIIHTQTPGGVGIEALLVAKLLRIPFVGTNHTPIEEFMNYYPFHGKIATNFVHGIYSWYYNRCIQITTPCQELIDDMRQHSFKKPAQVMPNPLPSSLFVPPTDQEKGEIRKSFNFTGPVILYSGRMATEKHIDTIIKALPEVVKKFANTTLIITGHGIIENDLRKLANDLAVGRNIFWSGFVNMQILAKLYKAADIFSIMSTAETQSLALMQAYATGMPGIGADARGLKDYIPSECGFKLKYDDSDGLARLLLDLLVNDSRRKALGETAKQFAKQFQPELIAKRWLGFYNEAIHKYLS